MRSPKKIFIVALVSVIALCSTAFIINRRNNSSPNTGFAVVELFTSEGCSSCPPADELLAKIQKESNNLPVYILAFHVDYWNRLGWKDVFSNPIYSDRQYQYSNWLKQSGVYTPQVVVNGRKEFIGSEEGNLRNAIKNGLQSTTATLLHLSNIKIYNQVVEVQYHVEALGSATSLVLALVQKAASTKVKGGENGGRTLSHVQIVRSLKTFAIAGENSGSAKISFPEGLDPKGLELIAFLQNIRNGEITAAAKLAFSTSTTTAQVNVAANR